eukprot:13499525-Alexandrium_andersonii.AAC.1
MDRVDANQFGFRAGRQAQEHLMALKQMIQKSMKFSTGLCVMQADVRKAFDTISHKTIAMGVAKRG